MYSGFDISSAARNLDDAGNGLPNERSRLLPLHSRSRGCTAAVQVVNDSPRHSGEAYDGCAERHHSYSRAGRMMACHPFQPCPDSCKASPVSWQDHKLGCRDFNRNEQGQERAVPYIAADFQCTVQVHLD